jgi:hypothetical protein
MCACASLEGLTAGTPAGEVDGGALDANGAPVDGSPPKDGGVEAAVDGGGRFCRGVDAAFCADFDEGPLGTDWSELVTTPGIFELTTTLVRSKPNALHMAVADGGADGFLRKALQAADGKLFRVTADVNPACTSFSSAQFKLIELRCTSSVGDHGGATFTLSASGPHKLMTTRVGLGPIKVAEFDVSLPPEVWRSLSIEATFGAPGVLTVTVDGIPVVSATPSFGCQDTASFDLVVGLSGSGGPCNAYVDNVVVER